MKHLSSLLSRFGFLGMLSAVALFLTGCDNGNKGTATGPSAGSSFSGAVISFNPTITFTSGTTFSWSNETGDNAALLITEVGSPATGTFTYVPSSDYRTGTLTFTFTSITRDPVTLNLSNFTGTATGIASFTVAVNSVTYNGRVLATGSALLPQVTITVPGTGGTGGTTGGTAGDTITSGTTYDGTLGAPVNGLSFGPNSASLTPVTLATGATSFKVSSDRSKVFFNGRTAGVAVGTSVPGLGSTGTYILTTSATSVTSFSIVFSGGVPIGAFFDSQALSGSGATASGKAIRQEISSIAAR